MNKVLEIWNEVENEMFNDLILREVNSRRSSKNIRNLGTSREISLIPLQVKTEKISKKIRKILSAYVNEMKNYKSSLKIRKSIVQMKWLKKSLKEIHKSRPLPPNILSEFTKELIQDMIKKSTKKRRSTFWITK